MKNELFLAAKNDLKENHDIDILEDVLLRGNEYLLLYADNSEFNNIVLKVISGDLSLIGIQSADPFVSLSYFIQNIDFSNKYAEVSGEEEYTAYIMNELRKLPGEVDVTFPLKNNGVRTWTRLTAYPIPKNPSISIFGISNVTRLLNSEELIYEKTHKDALTGLFNTYSFDYHYGMRYKKPDLHVLYLDLDNFKTVNDEYGHPVGDELLKAFANILKSYQNGESCFYRLGGDEFLGLFFEKESQVKKMAEEIITKTQSISFPPLMRQITVSIGILKSRFAIDLARKADQILYKVKTSGKNHFLYEIEEE